MLDSNNLSLVNQEEQEVPRKVLQEYLEARTNYWEKQIKWLESDLELHKDADFVFVSFHHPLYSSPESDDRREEQRELRKRFEPLLKRYRVTAVFSGHDHFYERNEVDGIHYIVTGGGGAPLDEFGEPLPSSVKRESVHHFVMVDINDETASFTALTRDGRVIDAFESRTRH
jgi:3',5'-cyclic AMP phosphodiesterase CpdA